MTPKPPLITIVFGLGLLLQTNIQVMANPTSTANTLGILQYLQSDLFIRPGIGLRDVFLGQPIKAAIEKLGDPVKYKRTGLVSRSHKLVFKLNHDTYLGIKGKNRIRRLQISATDGSLYRTREGARFGMRPAEVIALYGKVDRKTKRNQIYYPLSGIGFVFSKGKLSSINIFPIKRNR